MFTARPSDTRGVDDEIARRRIDEMRDAAAAAWAALREAEERRIARMLERQRDHLARRGERPSMAHGRENREWCEGFHRGRWPR